MIIKGLGVYQGLFFCLKYKDGFSLFNHIFATNFLPIIRQNTINKTPTFHLTVFQMTFFSLRRIPEVGYKK